MRKKTPQRYFVPGLGIEIKVDALEGMARIAHLPGGPERTTKNQMKRDGWIHLGPWERKEILREVS